MPRIDPAPTPRPSALLLLCLAACAPVVPVGSGATPVVETPGCEMVFTPSQACPARPWGAATTFTSTDDVEVRLLGRWLFCGGERRYTGRGALSGFPHGAGVELWKDSGTLRWAFLRGTPPQVVRSDAAAAGGVATLRLENGQARAVLRAGDGHEATWNLDLFPDAGVLQNSAFDVWTFIPSE